MESVQQTIPEFIINDEQLVRLRNIRTLMQSQFENLNMQLELLKVAMQLDQEDLKSPMDLDLKNMTVNKEEIITLKRRIERVEENIEYMNEKISDYNDDSDDEGQVIAW